MTPEEKLNLVRQFSLEGNRYYEKGQFLSALKEFKSALSYAERQENIDILSANINDLNLMVSIVGKTISCTISP